MQKWIILIVVCIIVILGGIVLFNSNVETEYIPETEIEDIELRKTMVSLYFPNKDTKEIERESRLIDSKRLLKNPYEELIKMLIEGPESENLEKVIPNDTKLLGATLNNNIVTINFSEAFVENSTDEKQRYNSIYTLVNTLSELTEVTGVKLIINGNEIDGFTEEGLDFHQIFQNK